MNLNDVDPAAAEVSAPEAPPSQPVAPAPQSGPNALVNGTACLMVSFSRPGIKRKLSDDQYVAGTADKILTSANKVIVDSPEYKQVAAFEGHVKFYLTSKALPSRIYRYSTYLIPLKVMKEVDDFLENARKEWQEKVEEFISTYPARKAETMKRLGTIASEADYKTEAEIRADFGFDYEYVTMSTPSTLKQISAAMFEREEQRLLERLKVAEADIVAAYRAKFAAAVADMKDILDGKNKDGKAMRFHGWKIANLQKYIEQFKAEQNVCGDNELVGAMDEASKLLAGVDPKELKSDEKWRAALSTQFSEIGKKLETMTRVRGKRLINVDDDEEVA